ncbi:nuclear pore complex protein Nup50 isoform X2 [Phycodurus eques]|uniref:nuclear pore complex protein Nup50 isoform X2 n=1 Tax=Phycodurus eques TaxID=693459 RepID=UPI002ACD39FA|nr:nuclear pore complex protein Nup50 isoform X2 [Phycodurus eques]
MAKRIADKELTDRNWDQEEEGEEAGTFSVATEDVMKNRNIKKAKRRNVGPEGEAGGAFRGFKGFSASASLTPTPFSAFGNGGGFKRLSALTNGSGGVLAPSFAAASSSASTTASAPDDSSGPAYNGSADVGAKPAKEYGRQLTALNCSVRDWISKHVDDNPLCDLQPIFRDYERHLASIERQYGAAAGTEDRKARPSLPASSSSFSFKDEKEESPAVTFNFGQKVDSSVLKTATPAFSLFGGASQPFAQTDRAAPSEANAGNDDDAYEPPEPDVKEIKEDDAFYSKKYASLGRGGPPPSAASTLTSIGRVCQVQTFLQEGRRVQGERRRHAAPQRDGRRQNADDHQGGHQPGKHPPQRAAARRRAVLAGGQEQRDGGVRAQPARGRQEPGHSRAPPHPRQDRRRRRPAAPDSGGEARVNAHTYVHVSGPSGR